MPLIVQARQHSLLSLFSFLQLNPLEAILLELSPQSQLSSRRSAGGISRMFFPYF